MTLRIAAARNLDRVVSWSRIRAILGILTLTLGIGIATTAQSESRREDRRHGARHHHKQHHAHGARATVVIRPAWGYHHRRYYAPEPRIVYHRHPRWVPAYGPGFHCRPWEGPVWNGRYYEHVYGTVCLMPDGTWQLMG